MYTVSESVHNDMKEQILNKKYEGCAVAVGDKEEYLHHRCSSQFL